MHPTPAGLQTPEDLTQIFAGARLPELLKHMSPAQAYATGRRIFADTAHAPLQAGLLDLLPPAHAGAVAGAWLDAQTKSLAACEGGTLCEGQGTQDARVAYAIGCAISWARDTGCDPLQVLAQPGLDERERIRLLAIAHKVGQAMGRTDVHRLLGGIERLPGPQRLPLMLALPTIAPGEFSAEVFMRVHRELGREALATVDAQAVLRFHQDVLFSCAAHLLVQQAREVPAAQRERIARLSRVVLECLRAPAHEQGFTGAAHAVSDQFARWCGLLESAMRERGEIAGRCARPSSQPEEHHVR